MNLRTIYHIYDIGGGVDIKQIRVENREHAREILENGEYTEGWYYRANLNTKWLIVKKSEYDRNQL